MAQMPVNLLRYLLENLVLISHAIPMSIYVAIEVLKWFQVRNMERDKDLMQDPGNVDLSKMALGTGMTTVLREQAERN